MNWTPAQQEAIEYRGKNVLLSAAAGSGKTAVLVQRVIEMIIKDSVSVSELLILTFTEAAAKEMKHKIAAAIDREFLANPQNTHLKNQRILINSANISTIHAFCLEVIKGNIHKTDIPVNFSIISEIENTMLKEKALDAVLSAFYKNIDILPSFKQLALGYGSDKGDKNLRKTILGIMNFASSMPYPSKWLNCAAKDYKFETFTQSPWHKRLFEYSLKLADNLEEIYNEILGIIDSNFPKEHSYYSFFINEKNQLSPIKSAIAEKSYDNTRLAIKNFKFERIPPKSKKDTELHLAQDKVKSFRELAKSVFKDLAGLFTVSEERTVQQLKDTEPVVRTLKNIVLMTMRLHKNMKRAKDFLDFNDLEHELLHLLARKDGHPTKVALSLREKYREILVDEYQDSNYIQEYIFSLISRNETNIFAIGDIKQSIYKFRNAVPDIFTAKYARYEHNDGGHLIALSQNFRSRSNVIDFTNFIFEKIMTPKIGQIEYGEKEKLVQGAHFPTPNIPVLYGTEINIVDGRETENATISEALSIGRYILKTVNEKKLLITDSKTSELRPVQFSDIVILMRNTKSTAPVFEEVFEKLGIPLYSESGRSYLTTVEVQTVLSYLQIIDNPHQDIPLIAVLRSPIWKFTPDMLATIRSKQRKTDFYDALQEAAKSGDVSCARFIGELEELRFKAEFLKVSDLILTICEKYHYTEIVSGMKNGRQKAENLRLLFERAAEFDTGSLGTLSGFMLYIQAILDSDKDLSPARIDGENSDSVTIMSIHKSKGLEFPVVILANAFSEFNTDDIRQNILRHDRYGLGLKFADTEKRIIYPSVPHKIITGTMKEELLAEEIRLLYVALTRAKEKLVISAVIKNRTSAWASPYLAQDRLLTAGILSARSLGDFILYALATHQSSDVLDDMYKILYEKRIAKDDKFVKISVVSGENADDVGLSSEETKNDAEDKIDAALNDKLSYSYAYAGDRQIPLKISVSEAKHHLIEEGFYTPQAFSVPTLSATQASMISPTDKGTITHFVLQHINVSKTATLREITEEIEQMVVLGLIGKTQMAAVSAKSIYAFFQSDIGRRLKDAKQIWKEFNFYTEVDAKEIYPNLAQDADKILLQGTIDCFFEEKDGNIVLLDYKTDRIAENEILSRGQKYIPQLKYYKKGLEDILEKPINDVFLYFISLGEEININELTKGCGF